MAFTVASGMAENSGTYIPQLWDANIQVRFYALSTVWDISNTDYEGTIKKGGDKVYIRTLPDIDVSTYTKGQRLVVQSPTTTNKTLNIDQGMYFSFLLEDVDEVQSDIERVNAWSETAARQMQVKIDQAILQAIYTSGHASNQGATAGVKSASFDLGVLTAPLALDKTNVLDTIANAGAVLDEQNVPDDGKRWMVLPPIFTNLISRSDLKDASLSGDGESILRNGRMGIIDRFTIYKSNNLYSVADTISATSASVTDWYPIFGHPIALTFASQLEKTESIKSQDTFGTIIRGLEVYGYSVVKTEAMGNLCAYKA